MNNRQPSPCDPTRVYPPDLMRPIVAYRHSGDDLGGQVVAPFEHNGVHMAVDVFLDPRYGVERAHLIPMPACDPMHPLRVRDAWLAAEDALDDLADLAREKSERRAARLYDLAAEVVNAYKQKAYKAVEQSLPSLRRYGS